MPTRTISFSTYSDSGATTPWQVGNSTPAYPSGYTQGGDPARILVGKYKKFSGSGNTVLLDDTVLTGNIISASAILGTVGSDSFGVCLCTPAGTGYQFLVNSTNIRCFAMTAFVLGSQVGSSINFVVTSGHELEVIRNNTTGAMEVYSGVAGGALTLRGTITQANANTDWRAGVFTRNAAEIASLTSEYTAAQTVNSINAGNDITEGQSAVPADLSGFTSRPTSITTNQTGITCSNIGGTTNAPTFNLSGWAEGQPYPVLPVSVEFTFTYLTESAAGTETVTYSSDYTKTTFSSPVTDDNTYVAYWIDQDGHETDGGTFYWTTFSDLSVASDGGITVTGTGQFTAWFRPASGATAGNMYEYTFTVVDGSIVSGTRKSGYISIGIGLGFGI